jgi:cell division protein FtsB
LLGLIAAGLLAWGILGGSQGLLALVLSQREKANLREEIEALEQENRRLQQQVALLESRPEAYEKTARERLLLMRPGEIIYRFQ